MKIIKRTVVIVEMDELVLNRLKVITEQIVLQSGDTRIRRYDYTDTQWLTEVKEAFDSAIDEKGELYWLVR